jgi:hypothetical protein
MQRLLGADPSWGESTEGDVDDSLDSCLGRIRMGRGSRLEPDGVGGVGRDMIQVS